MDTEGIGSWIGLLVIGLLLILVGFEGNAGRVLAVAFAPNALNLTLDAIG